MNPGHRLVGHAHVDWGTLLVMPVLALLYVGVLASTVWIVAVFDPR